MATIFEEPCDGTDGANATTGNTAFTGFNTVGTVPQFSTAQKFTGTSSLNCSVSGTFRFAFHLMDTLQTVQGRRFYFRMGGFPSATALLATAEASAVARGQIQVLTDGSLRIRNGSTAVGPQSSPLTVNTWYRAEWWLNNTTSQQRCAIYAGDSLTAFFDSGTQVFDKGTFDSFKVGCLTNTSWSDLFIDQVKAIDTATFPGPVGTPVSCDVGADQTMVLGDNLTLTMNVQDGTGTKTYGWTLDSFPSGAGSSSQFATPSAISTVFTPTATGVYVPRGTVTDGSGSDFDTLQVTVSAADRMRFSRAVVMQG